MKQHLEEKIERLRQQLEDNQAELMVKDRELKKLKYNQLMIDTQQLAQNTTQYMKNLNHTVRHSNGGHKFDMAVGPLSTKNDKGQSRAQILEKLKEGIVSKSAEKKKEQEQEEEDINLPETQNQLNSQRSLQSGELDNTSEKSASQSKQLDKSSEVPAPSVAASVTGGGLNKKSPTAS